MKKPLTLPYITHDPSNSHDLELPSRPFQFLVGHFKLDKLKAAQGHWRPGKSWTGGNISKVV